jgi:hypothetical protein
MRPIVARRQVAARPTVVFALLADLREHWALADRWTEVEELDGAGGTLRLRGPLGVRRTATVRLERLEEPTEIEGTARLGAVTRARVLWRLEGAEDGGTAVSLTATIERSSRSDRLLLALGARSWLTWRFAATLQRLEKALADVGVPGTVAPVGPGR